MDLADLLLGMTPLKVEIFVNKTTYTITEGNFYMPSQVLNRIG
jgi:hypothetical protein